MDLESMLLKPPLLDGAAGGGGGLAALLLVHGPLWHPLPHQALALPQYPYWLQHRLLAHTALFACFPQVCATTTNTTSCSNTTLTQATTITLMEPINFLIFLS
jgi:hypothetical protein